MKNRGVAGANRPAAFGGAAGSDGRPRLGVIPGVGKGTNKIVYALVKSARECGISRVKAHVYFSRTLGEPQTNIASSIGREFERYGAQGLLRGGFARK